jgi:dipeptide/tripeptide permease
MVESFGPVNPVDIVLLKCEICGTFLFLTSSKGAGHEGAMVCMASLPWWGFLADRYLGYRWAVVLGALMTLGHASMAVETPLFYILELGFLL